MKRHWLVTVLAVMQSLLGCAALALAAFLLRLSFAPGITRTEVIGSREAAAIFGVSGLVWIALALLVLFVPRWGWWLGVGLNLTFAIALTLDTLGDWRQSDLDDVALAAIVVVIAILYLLPPVRRSLKLIAVEIPHQEISSKAGA